MPRPIAALLTDFGTSDTYVGALKGAILSICREATIVDVTHALPPQDVAAAGFALDEVRDHFPAGTAFVAVVDPGVGSARRGLAAQIGERLVVAPDNGLLTLVLARDARAQIREITNRRLCAGEVSATFHGRDVFGPVAAHWLNGTPLAQVGPEVHDPVRLEIPVAAVAAQDALEASVIHVDRFGNVITNVARRDLAALLGPRRATPATWLVFERHPLPLVQTYADVAAGEPCVLLGSSGWLELAVNRGSAAQRFDLARGARIRLRCSAPGAPESSVL